MFIEVTHVYKYILLKHTSHLENKDNIENFLDNSFTKHKA